METLKQDSARSQRSPPVSRTHHDCSELGAGETGVRISIFIQLWNMNLTKDLFERFSATAIRLLLPLFLSLSTSLSNLFLSRSIDVLQLQPSLNAGERLPKDYFVTDGSTTQLLSLSKYIYLSYICIYVNCCGCSIIIFIIVVRKSGVFWGQSCRNASYRSSCIKYIYSVRSGFHRYSYICMYLYGCVIKFIYMYIVETTLDQRLQPLRGRSVSQMVFQ